MSVMLYTRENKVYKTHNIDSKKKFFCAMNLNLFSEFGVNLEIQTVIFLIKNYSPSVLNAFYFLNF